MGIGYALGSRLLTKSCMVQLTNLLVACIITSAASAASSEVFIASRYLFFLAEAGHAPKFLGTVWPKDPAQRLEGRSVPVYGVLVTTAFASLSFMCMNTAGEADMVRKRKLAYRAEMDYI